MSMSIPAHAPVRQSLALPSLALPSLAALSMLAGCTVGVDGDWVGTGGGVVHAEAALLSAGPVTGNTVALRTEGSRQQLDVAFSVEAEAEVFEARLELAGDVIDTLHSGGDATLILESAEGGQVRVPIQLESSSPTNGRYRLRLTGSYGNEAVEGFVDFQVQNGHC